jgi:RimJ/RimL family protein N-acetyltransferase
MKKLDIKEILGICVVENIASIKVLEKAGFTKVFEGMGVYQDKKREICKYVYKLI